MIQFRASDRFLVVGASGGIGRGVCKQLNALGATVLAVGRKREALDTLVQELGGQAPVFPLTRDLAVDLDGHAAWLASLVERHGALRGLVYAAGTLAPSPLRVLSLPAARAAFDVNTLAPLALVSGLQRPGMLADRGSSIVLISSTSALRGLPSAVTYSSTKAAMNAALGPMALELAVTGTRINVVMPAMVETEMTSSVPVDQVEYLVGQQFLPGMIQPSDVGALCAFLLSDASRMITGHCLVLDAGASHRLQPAHSGKPP